MNSIFENEFNDFFKGLNDFFGEVVSSDIKMNIIERADSFEVSAEASGYQKEDIKIDFENGYLSLEYQMPSVKEEKFLLQERLLENKKRNVYIGDIDVDGLKAKLENGLLFIFLPKVKKESKKAIIIE